MDQQEKTLTFEYINWEGKQAIRTVKPIQLWYGSTQWHPQEGWLLKALDIEKNEERDFSVTDIIRFIKEE